MSLASFQLPASEAAYAKLNLALHLTGRLPNGYHQLDSVVMFVDIGDMVQAELREDGLIRLEIDGPFAKGLPVEGNLVLRAAQLLQQHSGTSFGADIRLDKLLPVGAGIGGGSADAAAALRLLGRLWRLDYSLPALAELSEQLGADIPACIFSNPLRMEGIGERLSALPHLPPMAAVLVYPHEPLWTPEVYAAVVAGDFSGQLPPLPRIAASQEEWWQWLQTATNDLELAAKRLNGQIPQMLSALTEQQGCVLARMSGSGSACFGLFHDRDQAKAAASAMQKAHPKWWIRAASALRA